MSAARDERSEWQDSGLVGDPLLDYVAQYLHHEPLPFDHAEHLAHVMVRGREAKLALRYPAALSKGQVAELTQQVYQGDQALEELLLTHLRLVVRVARQVCSHPSLLMDLICEGNATLTKLIERYDPRRNVSFCKYVQDTLHFELRHFQRGAQDAVRVPRKFAEHLARGQALYSECEITDGHPPDESQFLRVFGGRPSYARRVFQACQEMRGVQPEDASQAEGIEVFEESQTQRALERHALRAAWDQALLELPELQRRVVKLRVGYDGDVPLALVDIAAQLGVSLDRVKRVSMEATVALRAVASAHHLDLFL